MDHQVITYPVNLANYPELQEICNVKQSDEKQVEVPLFHNAHAIMYPIGSMCVVERGACVHVQLLTIAVCVMV